MDDIEIAYNMGYRVINGIPYGILGGNIRAKNIRYGSEAFSISIGSRTDGSRRTFKVSIHRLVAFQKFGKRIFDEGILVRHLDGNSFNNLEDNIGIGTASDNQMDIPKKERFKRSINASTKVRVLTDDEVLLVKNRRMQGATYQQLVDEFKLSGKGQAHFIVNNDYVTKYSGIV